ncbi:MAG: hypothetical protein ACREC9_12400 [Methylocella sp.]
MQTYEFDHFERRFYQAPQFDRRAFWRFIWLAAMIFVVTVAGVAKAVAT